VKLIKLKRTQSVCTEKERKEERKREKTEKTMFFYFLLIKKNSHQNKKQNKITNALGPGPRAPVPWCPGTRDPI
jgi:hypothetical protein